jgi:hypothetical protein
MEFGDGGFSGGGSGGSFKVDVFNLNHIFKIKTEPLELSSCFAACIILRKQGIKL